MDSPGGNLKSKKGMPILALILIPLAMVATFQNCGPAVLQGESASSSDISKSGSTVGSKVDLTTVTNADFEVSSNILYPSLTTIRKSYYSNGAPMFENLVLNQNDFDRIEWIEMSTGFVISNGTVLEPRWFSISQVGQVLIVGYRGKQVYQLGHIELAPKGTTLLNVNSTGAVNVSQRLMNQGISTESFLIEVDAPSVDLATLQITNRSTGKIYLNQRALLVSKSVAEAVSVDIAMTDMSGQSFLKTLTFPSTGTTPTTTIPTTVSTTTTTTVPAPTTTTTTLPSTTVLVPGSIAAPDMLIKSTGKQEGAIWDIFSIGFVSNKFSFPTTGTYLIKVNAFGSVAATVWPYMEIRVDKVVVYATTVSSATLAPYTVAANITAGVHDIEVGFTNDYSNATEDRNLYVGTVSVDPEPASLPSGLTNITARSDAANIYFSFDSTSTNTFSRVLLDTDRSITTGYANSGIGADYLIENGLVYKYSGTNNTWTWTRVAYSGFVTISPTTRWSIPRSAIGVSTAINYVASVNQTRFSGIYSHTLSTTPSTNLAISDGPYLFNLNSTSATIQWSVNMPATGKIDFGLTNTFGSTSTPEVTFNYTTHQQIISGLLSGRTYFYRITSTSQSGTTAMSPILTFTTP
jgi:hypothetical protein